MGKTAKAQNVFHPGFWAEGPPPTLLEKPRPEGAGGRRTSGNIDLRDTALEPGTESGPDAEAGNRAPEETVTASLPSLWWKSDSTVERPGLSRWRKKLSFFPPHLQLRLWPNLPLSNSIVKRF
jgi:hypothetical protein